MIKIDGLPGRYVLMESGWGHGFVFRVFRFASGRVVFLSSWPMILSFFSSRGWESWDVERRPLFPERMPVLVDDDLLFEDGPGAVRPTTVVNRWLRELPSSGCPASS